MNCIECRCVGEKTRSRCGVDRVILKQYNVQFQNQHNSPSLYSVLCLARSMPLGYSKILLHSLVGNFEFVGWEIVNSLARIQGGVGSDAIFFFTLQHTKRTPSQHGWCGILYHAVVPYIYIHLSCIYMYLRLWMDG